MHRYIGTYVRHIHTYLVHTLCSTFLSDGARRGVLRRARDGVDRVKKKGLILILCPKEDGCFPEAAPR